MNRSFTTWFAAALALAMAASAADAQPIRHARHAPQHDAVRPGDIVVHARSYLDPGPAVWSEVGTGNRYVGDTTPYSYMDLGGTMAGRPGSYEVLPQRFNPPGQSDTLSFF